jgi:hypothetical protein
MKRKVLIAIFVVLLAYAFYPAKYKTEVIGGIVNLDLYMITGDYYFSCAPYDGYLIKKNIPALSLAGKTIDAPEDGTPNYLENDKQLYLKAKYKLTRVADRVVSEFGDPKLDLYTIDLDNGNHLVVHDWTYYNNKEVTYSEMPDSRFRDRDFSRSHSELVKLAAERCREMGVE